jgi:urease accessory protein UreF
MWPQQQWIVGDAAEWLGDVHPLVEQLGAADGLAELHSLSQSLQSRPVADFPALVKFLRLYREEILIPHELPAIQMAYTCAAGNATRELVAYDKEIAAKPALKEFSSASRRVGRAQLQRLKPLRDERLVQRYLHAVENGEANGWHTLVYGMTLALYSLPLRQGLLGYAWQTSRSFIHAAAKPLKLTEEQCRELLQQQCDPLPAVVEGMVRVKATAETK